MRTETITTNIYEFNELSDKAKEKARDWWKECTTIEDWSEQTYEDAAMVGIKIIGFDIGRGDDCMFDDSFDADEVYAAIIKNHGEKCDTYKSVYAYNAAKEATLKQAPRDEAGDFIDEDILDDKLNVLVKELKHNLQKDYLKMLRSDHDYYFSDENVSENIITNEYEFLENGSKH
ncbi:MAG: hypothetical protein V3V74_07315 [Nitrosomonadaceae bacterium]